MIKEISPDCRQKRHGKGERHLLQSAAQNIDSVSLSYCYFSPNVIG